MANTTGFYNTAIGNYALYRNSTGSQNSAIGVNALWANTTGQNNTANGSNALRTNSTGSNNSAIGGFSLYNNTSGSQNDATGASSLYNNTTGSYNTANGYKALNTNTTGNYNVASGSSSMERNTFGHNNIAIGNQANYYNQEGSNNTIIGSNAGMGSALHNKSGNIFLGYSAGYNETGDNKLYIENSNSATPLIYGDFANDSLRVNGTLDIKETLKIEGGSPGAGKVLTSDASGNASWENASGGGGGLTLTSVSSNVTLTTSNQIVVISNTSTVTLPASPATGQILYIHTYNQSATVNFNSKEIRQKGVNYAGTSYTFTALGSWDISMVFDGTRWLTFAFN